MAFGPFAVVEILWSHLGPPRSSGGKGVRPECGRLGVCFPAESYEGVKKRLKIKRSQDNTIQNNPRQEKNKTKQKRNKTKQNKTKPKKATTKKTQTKQTKQAKQASKQASKQTKIPSE